MKALSIQEPWASAIAYGDKRIENRTWGPSHIVGQTIAIHASKTFDKRAQELHPDLPITFEEHQCGLVIATAQVVEIVNTKKASIHDTDNEHQWGEHGLKWWILDNVQPLIPFPARGHLGLWDVDYLDLSEAIMGQFFKDTGYLAPGKDYPFGFPPSEKRQELWLKWLEARAT